MAEEEVFEINDYSTSSEWERFIADLEEALTQWNLNGTNFEDSAVASSSSPQSDSKTGSTKTTSSLLNDPKLWSRKQESLKFGKVCFALTYHSFLGQNAKHRDESLSSISSPKPRENSGLSQAWCDMNNLEHDWTASGSPLIRYYGLTQFLTLSCSKTDTIDTEDRIKHLIGSATIALKNTNCEVPFFVQICQAHRRLFSGVHILTSGFRTHFDMIQFSDVPASFQYLSELMTLFKKKMYSSFSYSSAKSDIIRSSSASATTPTHYSPFDKEELAMKRSGTKIQVSVRFTYLLSSWPPQYLIFNGNGPAHPALEEFTYLLRSSQQLNMTPCAIRTVLSSYLDPLNQFQLATTWPSVAEELITDNAYHSDLQPRNAPKWSLRAVFAEPQHRDSLKLCWASQWLKSFLVLKIKHHNAMLAQFTVKQRSNMDSSFNSDTDNDFRSPLDRLSSPAERVIASTTENLEAYLMSDNKSYQSRNTLNVQEWIRKTFLSEESKSLEEHSGEDKIFGELKASPIGSLSWKIAVLLANVFSEDNSIFTLSNVWKCIVEQLREHWEKGQPLPGVCAEQSATTASDGAASGSIDYGQCLFHQKLQMLNCCIAQKIKREHKHKATATTTTVIDRHKSESEQKSIDSQLTGEKGKSELKNNNNRNNTATGEEDRESEDEFYDCETDDEDIETSGNKKKEQQVSKQEEKEAENECEKSRAEGQWCELKDHSGTTQYRLDDSDIPIFIPLTQDPAPMTEDQHQQHIQIIAALTSSPEDSKLKIRMQSAGLLSDMEAFKAANPGVGFEDFIRWHSPRDWIELEPEETKGSKNKKPEVKFGLSKRMKESTLWSDIWALAKPTPISRQTRLFNYTKEAEEILHSFESISVEKFVSLFAPILAKALVRKMKRFQNEVIDYVTKNVDNKSDIPENFLEFDLKSFNSLFHRSDYDNLIEECTLFEFQVSKFLSLLKKLIFAYESEAKKPFKDLLQPNSVPEVAPKRIGTGRKVGAKALAASFSKSEMIVFATRLLLEPDVEFSSSNVIASLIVRLFADGNRFEYESRTSVGERLPTGDDEDSYDPNKDEDKQQQQQQQMRLPVIPQLPAPNGKEFILRAPSIARPAPYSRPSSQRFYAFLLPGKEFRVATGFTEDTIYF